MFLNSLHSVRHATSGSVPQDRLLAFLRDRRSYPDHPRSIRMIETHASWVVLTPRRAYKVKKPVNFGFLDFSALEKRRYFCEREVMLNRRLCPDTYLGVVLISMKEGRLVFGPGDEIVEYGVEMRRLPERFFMLRRIERGEATMHDVEAIVAVLASFYQAQTPIPKIAARGRVAKLKINTDENFRQTQDFIGVTISRPAFHAIQLYTREFYRCQASLFAARVHEGRIRDCHGDLHLDHIHLTPARLTIYDCIEFNDRFRYIDVASDAAFLAMDFDFHECSDLSRHFATRLATMLADPGLLQLLDFYKCYRAYVRGKIESFHHIVAGLPDAERCACRARAERYFRLALQYAVCGSKPMALIVMGRVGSGKSTLARSLGRELHWPVFSSDRIRKELAGVPRYVRGGEREQRWLYAKRMSDKTYAALSRNAAEHARNQRGVILDATFSSRRRRERVRRVLERAGVAYYFVETRATTATIKSRLKKRARLSGEISDARLTDFPMIESAYEPPTELDPLYFFAVKTARTSEAVVVTTLKTLAQRHARVVVADLKDGRQQSARKLP